MKKILFSILLVSGFSQANDSVLPIDGNYYFVGTQDKDGNQIANLGKESTQYPGTCSGIIRAKETQTDIIIRFQSFYSCAYVTLESPKVLFHTMKLDGPAGSLGGELMISKKSLSAKQFNLTITQGLHSSPGEFHTDLQLKY